jgi:hypothetical protein
MKIQTYATSQIIPCQAIGPNGPGKARNLPQGGGYTVAKIEVNFAYITEGCGQEYRILLDDLDSLVRE